MLFTLVLASSLLQTAPSASSTLTAKVVEAIDQCYLYVKNPSWQHLRSSLLADTSVTVSSLDRQLTALHDGDLRIVTSVQIQAMQAEAAGKERGIGLVDFAVAVEPSTGEPTVVTPLVDSPAFKAGLRPDDVILSINGQTTQRLIHEDVMAMLRGDSGSLRLTILRGGERISMDLPMLTWDEQAVVARDFVAGEQHIGSIAVRLFTPDSGEQVRKTVESLAGRNIHKCIIDLRNNPGGYLDAMAVAGSAFTDRTLGWKVRRDDTREPIHAVAKSFPVMRLVVLINEGTASAAEILAAGLRDTTGAQLVGAKTHGRGQIQTYVALNESGGIVTPAAYAESLRGIRFNKGSGLWPDVVVSSDGDKTSGDAVFRRAVQLLTHG
ncbi:MAG TPA: S41 family peptidase [Edaphobacter sp.]|nr:S41 family peptidase [Edaphobacter sp.]